MNEKFQPAVWKTLFSHAELTSEPFELSAGVIKVSQKGTLYYTTPTLAGKKYRLGLGDVLNELGVSYPEVVSVEEARSLLTGKAGQFVKGELKPVREKKVA